MVSMLGYVYGNENGRAGFSFLVILFVHPNVVVVGDLSPWQSTGLKVAAPVGNVVGKLIFGCLADIFGRKRICE